jgi:hypothetical protein
MMQTAAGAGGSGAARDSGARYEVVVTGQFGPALAALFEGFELTPTDEAETRLVGWVEDQPALQALVRQLGELGVQITRLTRLPSES